MHIDDLNHLLGRIDDLERRGRFIARLIASGDCADLPADIRTDAEALHKEIGVELNLIGQRFEELHGRMEALLIHFGWGEMTRPCGGCGRPVIIPTLAYFADCPACGAENWRPLEEAIGGD